MILPVPVLDEVPADFYDAYVVKRRPVVLRGGARHWPAVGKWTPAYLREVAGPRSVTISGPDGKIRVALADYLDRVQAGISDLYLSNVFVHTDLPELSADVGRLAWAQPNWMDKEPFASMVRAGCPQWLDWCELFVSQPNTRYPIVHVDRYMTHAWAVQIYGSKRYWMWPPRPGFVSEPCLGRDLETFFDGPVFSTVVEAGDAIFLPAGWPHTAESVTTSITTSGNFVNDTNWVEFSRELCEGDLRAALRA